MHIPVGTCRAISTLGEVARVFRSYREPKNECIFLFFGSLYDKKTLATSPSVVMAIVFRLELRIAR